MVKNLAALGKTVLLTTHYMDEAQYLADRVAVISSGRIVAEGIAGHDRRSGTGQGPDPVPAPRGAVPPADLTGRPDRDGLIELVPDDLTTGAAPADRLGLDAARRAGPGSK